MPELPDVEIFRQEAEKALYSVVEAVSIEDPGFVDAIEKSLNRYITGNKLKKTLRRGKYLFLVLENNYAVAMHFGMTGYLEFADINSETPKYVKCIFDLDNDHRLFYVSKRKLGSLEITGNTDEFIQEHDIGPDALEIRESDFISAIKKSRSGIKSFLTNQSVISGIGNIYADEILFQARIHPKTRSNQLEESKSKDIYMHMIRVLKIAIEKQADVSKFPDSFLLPVRKEGEKCPVCRGNIEKIRLSGRTGYYCPRCQSKNE